jgi:hypothetical protein
MSNSDFIPKGQSQFDNWLTTFVSQCEANADALGLDTKSLEQIVEQAEIYHESVRQSVSTRMIWKGINAQKEKDRKAMEATVRTYARLWKADPAIPSQVVGGLGIITNTTSGPVQTVRKLTIQGLSNGTNELTWDRSGNAPGTIFVIESRFAESDGWDFVAAVTRTNYPHQGQIPGQTQFYRIRSTRAGKTSAPCPTVGIYTRQPGGNAQKAKAA